MKSLIFIVGFFLSSLIAYSQSVSINQDGSAPHSSAMLDVKSTIKGIFDSSNGDSRTTGYESRSFGCPCQVLQNCLP